MDEPQWGALADPIRQKVTIKIITRQDYLPVVWQLIGDQLIRIVLVQSEVENVEDGTLAGKIEKLGFRKWLYAIEFNIISTNLLNNREKLMQTLVSFGFQLRMRTLEAAFEQITED